MKTRMFLIFALLLVPAFLLAQTETTNTTLCAAQSATAKTVCLTATTHVKDGTGVYVDNEYEIVTVSNNSTVAAGPSYVNVRRGEKGGPPSVHANGAIAWLALTPSETTIPGENGFMWLNNLAEVGSCTRTSQIYLPHIWPAKGEKRDCRTTVPGGTTGMWVKYAEMGDPALGGIQLLATAGAIPIQSATYVITIASAGAFTLAAPTAGTQDGTVLTIYSSTAYAHTLTATGGTFYGGVVTNVTVYTFAAYAGSGITLMAYNGHWIVLGTVTGSFTS
jgi:hypothetical protein